MKIQSLSKISLFFSCFIFSLLFIVPLSGAEQADNDLSKQVFSAEGLRTLEGSLEEKDITPVVQTVSMEKVKASSFDVKIDLNERFKAFLSLGDQGIRDLAGRDMGQSYNAVFGFKIVLQ